MAMIGPSLRRGTCCGIRSGAASLRGRGCARPWRSRLRQLSSTGGSGGFPPWSSSGSGASKTPSQHTCDTLGYERLPPGLTYVHDFLGDEQHDLLADCCIGVGLQAEELSRRAAAGSGQKGLSADIPQPAHVKSSQHNLKSEESYVPLVLEGVRAGFDGKGMGASCEHFSKYGEDGHALTYFRGNQNIPTFVWEHVINRVSVEISVVKQMLLPSGRSGAELAWRKTLNIYKPVPSPKSPGHISEDNTATARHVAGFPFHVDIPANGKITMILSLLRGGTMQLVHKDSDAKDEKNIVTVDMEKGGLLVLSGEARYDWRHRVLPSSVSGGSGSSPIISSSASLKGFKGDEDSAGVARCSLVLGCK